MDGLLKRIMAAHSEVLDETGDCDLCALVAWADRAQGCLKEQRGFCQLVKEHSPDGALKALSSIGETISAFFKERGEL